MIEESCDCLLSDSGDEMTAASRNLMAGVLLVVAGCSTSVTGSTIEPTGPPSTSNTTTPVTVAPTSSSTTTSSPHQQETTTSTLAGREVSIGLGAGVSLAVVGIEHHDVLNMRAGPGVHEPVIATAEPTSTGLIAQGKTRMLPDGALWVEVEFATVVGWVYLGHVATLADTADATAFVVAQLGEYPTTTSMQEMGQIVASVFATTDPQSRIVMVATAAPGTVQDTTFDVIGVGDDAIGGYRIRVFAVPVSDGLGFHSAEVTTLCIRGVTTDGLCS